jgi:hypothetical protein
MTFLEIPYVGPHNEYLEEHRGDNYNGRILYDGIEVATLSYCEDYHWAELYAAAPELLAALAEAEKVIRWAAQEADGRVKAEIVGGWIHHANRVRAAIEKATGLTPTPETV